MKGTGMAPGCVAFTLYRTWRVQFEALGGEGRPPIVRQHSKQIRALFDMALASAKSLRAWKSAERQSGACCRSQRDRQSDSYAAPLEYN